MEKYRIKDVLFGLRDEYKEIEKQLEIITSQIELVNPEDKIDVSIVKEGNVTDLKLNLLRKQSAILKVLQSLGKNVLGDNELRLPLHSLIGGGEHGLILSDEKNMKLPYDSNDLFYYSDAVVSRPIVQQGPHSIKIREVDEDFDNKKNINIYPLGININAWEKHKANPSVPSEFLSYVLESDSLNYAAYRDLALNTGLAELLYTPVKSSELTDVEKEIIKRSNVLNKRVTLETYSILEDNQSFNIEDTHDEIILTRK